MNTSELAEARRTSACHAKKKEIVTRWIHSAHHTHA
jgi:hypothetical protein